VRVFAEGLFTRLAFRVEAPFNEEDDGPLGVRGHLSRTRNRARPKRDNKPAAVHEEVVRSVKESML